MKSIRRLRWSMFAALLFCERGASSRSTAEETQHSRHHDG